GVVRGVGELLDVEVALDLASGVGEERPLGAHGVPELVQLEDVVGRDGDDLRVGDGDPRIEGRELEMLLVVLRAEVATREDDDHGIAALELAEAAARLGVIGELVVREGGSGDDVRAHGRSSSWVDSDSLSGWRPRRIRRRVDGSSPVVTTCGTSRPWRERLE